MAARRRRRAEPEEHENSERWLVTYADMITLLMVLFIVMFAISQVDVKRFEQLKTGMAAGFGHDPSPLEGGSGVMPESGSQPLPPVVPALGDQALSPESAVAAPADRLAAARSEVARLQAIRDRIGAALRRAGFEDDVRMRIDERGLHVSLASRSIVFRADDARLTERGGRVVDTVAPVLRDLPELLEIEGHTNQVPVTPKYYATDWDLSAARAVTVLRRLSERGGVPDDRLSAVAHGNTRPLLDPDRPGSQQVNKRVDIVVLSAAPEETRALFDEVLADQAVL